MGGLHPFFINLSYGTGTIRASFLNPPAPNRSSSTDWDYDGMPDVWEYRYGLALRASDGGYDLDSDGLANLAEFQNSTDPTIASTDNDLLNDAVEIQLGYNPRLLDTDNDGTPDHLEDHDGDGLTNLDEQDLRMNAAMNDWEATWQDSGFQTLEYDDAGRLRAIRPSGGPTLPPAKGPHLFIYDDANNVTTSMAQ